MNSVSYLTPPMDLYGLYELSATGTILYSRVRHDDELVNSNPRLVGQNFFEEVARFENVEDFRRLFNRFISRRQQAENFTFDCFFEGGVARVKVMMLRVYEREYSETANVVIVDIRRFERDSDESGDEFSKPQ